MGFEVADRHIRGGDSTSEEVIGLRQGGCRNLFFGLLGSRLTWELDRISGEALLFGV